MLFFFQKLIYDCVFKQSLYEKEMINIEVVKRVIQMDVYSSPVALPPHPLHLHQQQREKKKAILKP